MIRKKKVAFLTVFSLAFVLALSNFVAFSAAAPAANVFSETAASLPMAAEEWTLTEIISTESTDDSGNPSLAVGSDGAVHVAWSDWTDYGGSGTDEDIFYKRFEPGSGWTTTEVVSTESTGWSYTPSLGVGVDGKVHIAWKDQTDYGGSGTDPDIFYKRFEPGSGWTLTEVVSTESTDPTFDPSLGVGVDGKVHIAWEDKTDYGGSGADPDIFYRRFEPGSGWTAAEVVSTESTDDVWALSLGVGSDGKVHVAWSDDTDYEGSGTDRDIFYKRFEPGSGWTAAEVVSTESTGSSFRPSLGVGVDGKVHIAWYDRTDYLGCGTTEDIFYKRFEPGSGWTLTEVVSTESTVDSEDPSLGVGVDGKVHIAWVEWGDYGGSGTDWDILYRRFVPGVGFALIEVVSTESTGWSYTPSLGVGVDGEVHIAWKDTTNYGGSAPDDDIFYKRLAVPEPPMPNYQYHFRLNMYADVLHMNLSDCGWITGIVTTRHYTVPLLGKYWGGWAVIAVDLPAGGNEMGLIAIKASSGTGYVMNIQDDISTVGPITVWFTEATEPIIDGKTLDEVATSSAANAETLYDFRMNPFDDVIHFYTDDEAWLWGWVDAPGPSYPAPLLGIYGYGQFFYAIDFQDGHGLHELLFATGSTSTLTGYVVRSPPGFKDPTCIWLTEP